MEKKYGKKLWKEILKNMEKNTTNILKWSLLPNSCPSPPLNF